MNVSINIISCRNVKFLIKNFFFVELLIYFLNFKNSTAKIYRLFAEIRSNIRGIFALGVRKSCIDIWSDSKTRNLIFIWIEAKKRGTLSLYVGSVACEDFLPFGDKIGSTTRKEEEVMWTSRILFNIECKVEYSWGKKLMVFMYYSRIQLQSSCNSILSKAFTTFG